MDDLFKNSIKSAKSIAAHTHSVLDQSMDAAGKHGPELIETEGQPSLFRVGGYELQGTEYRDNAFMDVSSGKACVSKTRIDFQTLSPNPLTYFHYINVSSAISFSTGHNDSLIDLITKHPDKLAGFAALPMQNIPAACEEMLSKLRFDSNAHDPRSFKLLTNVVGIHRLVLGTNFAGSDHADIHHSPNFLRLIADNARRLLHVSR